MKSGAFQARPVFASTRRIPAISSQNEIVCKWAQCAWTRRTSHKLSLCRRGPPFSAHVSATRHGIPRLRRFAPPPGTTKAHARASDVILSERSPQGEAKTHVILSERSPQGEAKSHVILSERSEPKDLANGRSSTRDSSAPGAWRRPPLGMTRVPGRLRHCMSS